jgi:hypothetical protein
MTQTLTFDGTERDQTGKIHIVHRTTCALCQEVLSEFHRGCCRHASSGFYLTGDHQCSATSEEPSDATV